MLNLLVASALTAIPAGCPSAVVSQLDGLYRWHLEEQDKRSEGTLESQKDVFMPALYRKLAEAWSLNPRDDGAFIDFVVFSGTQVSTFGAEVSGCRQLHKGVVEADVAVRAGLRGRTSEPPQQLTYRLVLDDDRWRVSDLIYNHSHGESSTLSRLLNDILRRAAEHRRGAQ